MTLDARSKERLEALGRTLPSKLPAPISPSQTQSGPASTSGARGKTREAARHRLEQEEDPAALFRALMKASPDGTVPPHLLERLRELEASRRQAPVGETPAPETARGKTGSSSQGANRAGRRGGSRVPADQDLYTAFSQLLLEEEDCG